VISDLPRSLRWIHRAGLLGMALLCAAPLVGAFLPVLSAPSEAAATAAEAASSARLWGLWGKTCGLAASTAFFASALGVPLGLLIASARPASARWMATFLSAPMLIPAHALAVAWIDILGPQGLLNDCARYVGMSPHTFPLYAPQGVVLVQTLAWYPIPMWAVWVGRRQIDPAVLDAARNLGSPLHAYRRIVLPLLAPAMTTGAIMVMLFSLIGFAVPSLLQVQVFTVEIYTSFNSLLDQRRAVLLSLPLVFTGAIGLWLAARLFQLALVEAHRMSQTHGQRRSTVRWRLSIVVAVTVLTTGFPGAALLLRSMPPSIFLGAASTALEELGTSLLLSIAGATLVLVVAFAVSLGPDRRSHLTLGCSAAAYLVSGPVFGVGLIQLWNHPGLPGFLYDHVSILILAVAGRYLVFGILGCRLAMRWVPRESIEAARNLGASPLRTLMKVILPPLRRPLFAVWACLALLVMGEVECIVLIAPPGWVPVSLRIFTLMHYGPAAMVSALALIQTLLTLVTLATTAYLLQPGGIYTPRKSRYHTGSETRP